MDIYEILKAGEGEDIEFKRSLSERKEILETICAFANTKGGTILIGVEDDGRIVGVDIGKLTIEKLVSSISSEIEPMIFPSVEVLELKGKKVIRITVPEGQQKPYFYRGRAYKRVGKVNKVMSKGEIERLILSRMERKFSFELKEMAFELDREVVRRFVEMVRKNRNLLMEFSSEEEVLERLGVKDRIAGLLCFGKNPQGEIPYAKVKIGLFSEDLLEHEEIGGNLFTQVEESVKIILRYLRKNIRISGLKRIEEPEIPVFVLREAITNAIIHRDYSIPSFIYIRIYPDRIEIENPGGLLPPLKPEDLKKEHPSILRNPKIAETFFLAGYIERWGKGTNKMIEECIKAGLKEPEFIDKGSFFKVIIYREVREIEKRIIEILKKRKEVTTKDISKILGISERTARKYLKELLDKGIIERKRIGKRIVYHLKTGI